MKNILYILLIYTSNVFAQKSEYVVIEEQPVFQASMVGPFSMRTNHVLLSLKEDAKRTFNIYNLYYSRNGFSVAVIDNNTFRLGATDYKKLMNDILITVTPLTDSLDAKLIKISVHNLKNMNIVTGEQLLQRAVRGLYMRFTKNEIARQTEVNWDTYSANMIKTYQYKIVIKRGNNYYKYDGRVLTEDYLVDAASYLFPVQYHDGELNTSPTHRTQYFSLKDIKSFREKNLDGDRSDIALSNRIYPEQIDSIGHLYVTKYNTVPVQGAGTFYFLNGVGVVNGSFDYYFNDVTKANYDIDNFETGKISLELKTINGLTIKQFTEALNKKYPAKIIGEM